MNAYTTYPTTTYPDSVDTSFHELRSKALEHYEHLMARAEHTASRRRTMEDAIAILIEGGIPRNAFGSLIVEVSACRDIESRCRRNASIYLGMSAADTNEDFSRKARALP